MMRIIFFSGRASRIQMGSAMPEWLAQKMQLPGRDLLPARHMKDRVPEKQPDAAQPPAQMVPEVHPSFLLTISKMALTDCSTVSPEVSSSTASAACFNGAMARSESCLSRCFVSARICA